MTIITPHQPTTSGATYERLQDKILGSIATAVIGDALGAPTETRSIRQIRELFGGRVEEFFAPLADSPYSRGRKAAQITDDSSQLLLLARVIIDSGNHLTARGVADMLLEWSEDGDYFPHFAGPSTRRAIELLRAGGDPEQVGAGGNEATTGASNGSAMRVGVVGLAHPGDVRAAVDDALITCRPSHFTSQGVSGAAAIAGAVAAALTDGATINDVVQAFLWSAEEGDRLGAQLGRDVPGASISARGRRAVEIGIGARSLDEAARMISSEIGTGLPASEAVPAAIGFFVAAAGDPWLTVVGAANAGDDTDTVACMAGSIAGAFAGFVKVPQDKYEQVLDANPIDIRTVADELFALVSR
ncbi:MAG TPA: ADP-ribosylglycohydrolase family protein [Plantibacter sp.]|uniref:ADP-ribosylglycohydrolase family protein n=1 Tax=unclassified Plantibacter TaxID=2624265 RepID=UPI002B619C46|nr:ADP-ribosylglycohydrolase family protein [Plantibacter sp.]